MRASHNLLEEEKDHVGMPIRKCPPRRSLELVLQVLEPRILSLDLLLLLLKLHDGRSNLFLELSVQAAQLKQVDILRHSSLFLQLLALLKKKQTKWETEFSAEAKCKGLGSDSMQKRERILFSTKTSALLTFAMKNACCDWTISREISSCFSSRMRSDSSAHIGSSVISRPAVMSLAVRTFCLTESSSPCTCLTQPILEKINQHSRCVRENRPRVSA